MKKKSEEVRIETGVRNLDDLLGGGLPKGSILVLAGAPGAGKTILAQQICFHATSAKRPVLYFNTLSEPAAKTLRYLDPFTFFDANKLDEGGVRFIDLGAILRTNGLEDASRLIMDHVKKVKPEIVVIDSFKVFDDLASSKEELRKFGYELAVNLMAWEATTLLLGEYGLDDISTNPLFSIVDGIVLLAQREQSGEHQRFLQIRKLRGASHSRDEHAFLVTPHGIEVFAPRVTIQREDRGPGAARCRTGIVKLDELLGEGIPRGSSLLISGVAGTGKTVLLLEFAYRGARAGEKGIIFSFEETRERLLATALGLGWDLDKELKSGMIEIVFIPQPNIMVEGDLLMMQERIQAMKARRVSVDSVSVFLHKVTDPQLNREKIFQLASIVQNAQAVGFFAADIPYGSTQLSRFGVEETVVDGVIVLSSEAEGLERQRYLEIYKLRNTAHLKGRHNMLIERGGITLFPRYGREGAATETDAALEPSRRTSWGVAGLDEHCGGGLLERSVTLVSGSSGIGKSTLALQFIVEGAKRETPGLYVALEEGPAQLLRSAETLGLPLRQAVEQGLVEILHLSHERVRASQLFTLLNDKIRARKVGRIVIDSIGQIMRSRASEGDQWQLLHALTTRFKNLDVTSLLTLGSPAMFAGDTLAEQSYSPLADNIVLLRYARVRAELRSTVTVMKTRGSAHDWHSRYFTIGQGGLRIGARAEDSAPARESAPRKQASS